MFDAHEPEDTHLGIGALVAGKVDEFVGCQEHEN